MKTAINREYKDSLFKLIYGREENKKWLLSLYNALAGTNHTDENEIELNIIENVVYITRKNDVSFLIGSEMYLLEHQSSYNPNLPLRGMIYFSQLYNKFVEQNDGDLYGTKLVKIPSPTFYVLYNGQEKLADKITLRLSDAFKTPKEGFEWTATMLNINLGHNKELLNACKSLQDYATYVKIVRDNLKKGMRGNEAVVSAVDKAVELNLLEGFFKLHKAEVLMNILTEFDQEKYDRCRRREGYEDGTLDTKLEISRKMLAKGFSPEMISECADLPLDEIAKLQAELQTA